MAGNKDVCIICESTVEDLQGMNFVRFSGTGYIMCYPCFEKLSMQFNAPLKHYHVINLDTPTSNISYKKKKINHKVRQEVYERDKYRCVYCGDYKNLTLDHRYPESLGGEATVDNLVTSCDKCNSKKGTKIIE